MKTIMLLTLFSLLITIPAGADIITITLDGVDVEECGETWVEAGVVLSFVETTEEDCDGGGSCYFGLEADRVWLYPARLNLELSGLSGNVTQAEVDIIDYCGVTCTRAFLYDGNTTVDQKSNSLIALPETLTLSSGGASIDRAAVSSCEGTVIEIRLTLESAATGIKGLVTDCETNAPIEAVSIIAIKRPTRVKTFTDEVGFYDLVDLEAGEWWLIGFKMGYKVHIAKVVVKAGEVTKHDFCLEPK